jgi:hypothetical protein
MAKTSSKRVKQKMFLLELYSFSCSERARNAPGVSIPFALS